VTKLWASRWENECLESCSACHFFGERVALQVARRVVLYVEPHSANALEESLLREYLLVELLGEGVARQVVAGRCRAAWCEISRIVTTERVARQIVWQVTGAFTSGCCSFTFSLSSAFDFSALSPCSFSLSLSPPTVALSLSRFHCRLNGGFGAGFRRNAFGFSAPSPFIYLS
jgi:hypothetical protein